MNYILIAHGPSVMRDGLSQIMSLLPAPATVLMVGSMEEVMPAMRRQTFDLFISHAPVAGHDVLSVINRVRKQHPSTRILLFSSQDENTMCNNVVAADGCLGKHSTKEEMQEVIADLLRGKKTAPLYVPSSSNPMSLLSSREIEVMNLLAKGLPLLKIAAQMELQLTTVSTYKARIFRKLEINSIVELPDKIRTYGMHKAV
jgi:DNA-binding NarL/FixJ family response regulator